MALFPRVNAITSADPVLLVTTCGLGVALFLLALRWNTKNAKERPPSRKKQRSLSYTSNLMATGEVFPPQAQVPEPIINAAVFFKDEECPSLADLAEQVVVPMLRFTRLNSIPEANTSSTRKSTKDYQPMDLIRCTEVDSGAGGSGGEGGDDSCIYDEIFGHLQDPLSRDRDDLPWWEILVIRNKGKGSSACVFRIHHSLADGISLVNVFEKIIVYEDGSPINSLLNFTAETKQQKQKPNKRGIFQTLWSILKETFHVVTLGLTPYDDDTAFSKSNHGEMVYSGNRSYVILPSVSLDFIKQLKNGANVTVNDILMTAISHAISEYCKSQDCPFFSSSKDKKIQCRALLPVAFPRPKDEMTDVSSALRNKWCFVSADMSVNQEDVLDRLKHIHGTTSELKASPRAILQLLIQNTLPPLLPAIVSQKTMFDVMTRHSLVFSNVPGPDRPCRIAGKVATSVQMFYANLIPQIGLLSYAGQVHGNFVLDPVAIPNSRSLAGHYASALLLLASRLNVAAPSELVQAAAVSSSSASAGDSNAKTTTTPTSFDSK